MSILLNRAFLIFLVILSSMLVVIILPGKIYVSHNALALSPYFTKKEIIDPSLDWVDMKTKQPAPSTEGLSYFADILSVDYYSDGKTLNTILWTFFSLSRSSLEIQ